MTLCDKVSEDTPKFTHQMKMRPDSKLTDPIVFFGFRETFFFPPRFSRLLDILRFYGPSYLLVVIQWSTREGLL